jgi:hypothetical protein
MNQFELMPHGSRWELTQAGTLVRSFANREIAVERSIQIVTQLTGYLRILAADGTIEEEHVFPLGIE